MAEGAAGFPAGANDPTVPQVNPSPPSYASGYASYAPTPTPVQSAYTTGVPPAQVTYPPAAPAPAAGPPYVTAPPPPSQPFYAPVPSQPFYGYGTAPLAPAQYGAPPTIPLNMGQGIGTALLPGLLGAPPPGPVVPRTRLQAFLVRNVNARMAVSAWFTALLGAIVAVALGLILTAAAESVWSQVIQSIASATATNTASGIAGGLATSVLSPDLLKLFMIEQHVPLDIHAAASASGTGGSLDIALNFPITGLLLLPAIALTVGGYLSAASDFTRQARFSVARGALMGPFYGVLLAILTFFGTTSLSSSILGTDISVSLSPDTIAAFLYGLLWGLIFGALGGWLQFAGRRSFADALPTLQAATRRRVYGAIAGAVVALVSGIAIFAVLMVGALVAAITAQHATITPNSTLTGSLAGTNAAALIVLLAFTLGPTLGIIAFTFAAGASFDIFGASNLASGKTTSYGLIGTPFHPGSAVYLLMLVPLICYIAGGGVSTRIAQARRPDEAMLAGALIALPFSVLFAGAAMLAGASLSASASIASASGGATPSLGGAFLAGLVGAGVGGAIGGASELAMPSLGGLPRALLLPFRPLALLVGPLLDGATGRPRGVTRSVARRWFYDGVTAAVVLVIAGIALDIISTLQTAILPFGLIALLDSLVAGLLIAVPLLYFYGGVVTAFSAPSTALVAPTVPAAFPAGGYAPPYAAAPLFQPGYYGPASVPLTSPPSYAGPASAPITSPGLYAGYATGAPVPVPSYAPAPAPPAGPYTEPPAAAAAPTSLPPPAPPSAAQYGDTSAQPFGGVAPAPPDNADPDPWQEQRGS